MPTKNDRHPSETREQMLETDAHLVIASRQGDRSAFAKLVERSQDLARGVAFAATRDMASAEDVVQEAFLSAWSRLRELREPAKFRPWLATIVRNTAHYQRRHRHRHAPMGDVGVEELERLPGAGSSPLDEASFRQSYQQAQEVLGELPSSAREVVMLYYTLDESHQQVAESLGLAEATVRKRLSRARQRLKEGMERHSRTAALGIRSAPSAAAAVLLAISSREALAVGSSSGTSVGVASGAGKGLFFVGGVAAGASMLAIIIAIVQILRPPTPESASSLPSSAQTHEDKTPAAHALPKLLPLVSPSEDVSKGVSEVASVETAPAEGEVHMGRGKVDNPGRTSNTTVTGEVAAHGPAVLGAKLAPVFASQNSYKHTPIRVRTERSSLALKNEDKNQGAVLPEESEVLPPERLMPSVTLRQFQQELWSP